MRYLTTARQNKEGLKEYIASSRKLLMGNLTTNEKKNDLNKLQKMFEDERAKLLKAKEIFEDDLQRFQSMKGDMESLHMFGSEQLTSKLEEMTSLNQEINLLN